MIWTLPNFRIVRVTPKLVAADAIVAGAAFTADGEGFEDDVNIAFVKHGITIGVPSLDNALRGKNVVVANAERFTFRLKEKDRPKRGVYDAIAYQVVDGDIVFAIRKKAIKIT
jgi:hypothetical protein